MPYDPQLGARVREMLADDAAVREQAMFVDYLEEMERQSGLNSTFAVMVMSTTGS